MSKQWRVAVVMALVAGLMSSMGAVEARKGKPTPPPPAEAVQVTIEMAGSGIGTTCTGALTMNRGSANMLRTDWTPGGQAIEFQLPISWTRSHPVLDGGSAFTGCHGGPLAGSGDGFFGYFILSSDGDGVAISSRFDYYWEYGAKGKRTTTEVLEFFEVGGTLTRTDRQPFEWSATGAAQTVSGNLTLRRFEKRADGTGVGWQSFGSAQVDLTITFASGA